MLVWGWGFCYVVGMTKWYAVADRYGDFVYVEVDFKRDVKGRLAGVGLTSSVVCGSSLTVKDMASLVVQSRRYKPVAVYPLVGPSFHVFQWATVDGILSKLGVV